MRKKILVVDDEDDILNFLELVLSEKGYQVATASGGQEALTKAQLERPDLVLLDIMMPQMDGWEVLKLLRVDEDTAEVPSAIACDSLRNRFSSKPRKVSPMPVCETPAAAITLTTTAARIGMPSARPGRFRSKPLTRRAST